MENISKNAAANTVSAVHQLDPTKYVRITEKPGAKLKVLFVGNSITRHMPLPSIGWTGDWGMAASCEEKDYVHQTVRLLEEKLGCPLGASYEEWIHINHYEEIDVRVTKWLYRQEKGYIASLGDAALKEIAAERIEEFTATLRKYML